MKMETERKMATATARRTPISSVQKTKIKNTGVKGSPDISSNKQLQFTGGKKLTSPKNTTTTTKILIAKDVGQDNEQQIEENGDSDLDKLPIQLLKKTRSEPLSEAGSSSKDGGLKKMKSENWDHNAQSCNMDHLVVTDCQQQEFTDKATDSEKLVEKKVEQEVDSTETEEKVQENPEQQMVVFINHKDNAGNGVENGDRNEKKMLIGKNDKERNGGGDQLNCTQIKSKRILSPTSTSTSSSPPSKPVSLGRKSVQKQTSSFSSPQSTTREPLNIHDHSSRTPETHGKLQFLVDLVMWRDTGRSAFIFGIGTFIIISSSFTKDLSFSLISVSSYLTLVYLAVVFLCKSFVNRGVIDDAEVVPENYVWGEDEAIWLAKMVLPYLNESLLKLRVLFSGDPAITMKVATVLFILARCGSSITVWKMMKLGFFGVFIIPKLCSSYSNQIIAYGGVFEELLPKEEYLDGALYTFDIGQNDLTAGYKLNMTTEQVKAYIPDVIHQFFNVVRGVYARGGRSFWIHNTGPLGCLPYMLVRFLHSRTQFDEFGCASPLNDVSQYYNNKLKEGVLRLRKELPLATITYVDIYSLKYSLITQSQIFGFEKPLVACCGIGGKYNFNNTMRCGSTEIVNGKEILVAKSCNNPSVRVNWDGIHYTEAANKWIFNRLMQNYSSYLDPPIPLEMVCHRSE